MKVAEALHGIARLFLDTAPIIYYVERNPTYGPLTDAIFDRIDEGRLQAVTSPITLAECLVMPFRLGQVKAQQDFLDLIVWGVGVTFVPSDSAIARKAAEVRVRYNLTLADAFQVATALVAGCDAFLTNDATLKRVEELRMLVLVELEA